MLTDASLEHLHAELRAAYDLQLQEHEQSMARFLQRIASLCEGNGTPPNAALLAHAVRGLATQQLIAKEDSLEVGAEVIEAAGLLGPSLAALKHSTSLRLMKQPMGGGPEGCHTQQPSPIPTLPTLPMSPPEEKRLPPEFANEAEALEATNREDAAKIEHEFTVPLLPFIDATGTVQHSESAVERIFGSRLKRFKHQSVFQASCMQARTGRFAQFIDGHWFKILSALMIMLNYYFIVYQTDYKMNNLGDPEPSFMFVIEVCFTSFYVWELCCQVFVYRKEFFLGHEMLWNMFDSIIVFVSVFELGVTLSGGKAINLSFLRVLRFLKISRVLRMFSALRLMKEIRIMVDALAGSFLIFVFCCIMLAMFFSIFSIFFVQGITTFLEVEGPKNVDENTLQAIRNDFGSVSGTMLSLFMAVTGGQDWGQLHSTVASVGVTYSYLFLFFIGFSAIAFLNVITGVFAEKAMSLALPTVDELMIRRTDKEKKDAQELVSLLHRVLGSRRIHTLNNESFEFLLEHPEVVKYLEVRGLKPCSARRFFTLLLEIHQKDAVDFGTFVSACIRLDGTASSIDLHVLSAELKSMQLRQSHMNHFLRENLQKIASSGEGQMCKTDPEEGQMGKMQPAVVYHSKPTPPSFDKAPSSPRPSAQKAMYPMGCSMPNGDDIPVEGLLDIEDTSLTSTMLQSSGESTHSSSNDAEELRVPVQDVSVQDVSVRRPMSSPFVGHSQSTI